MTELDDAVHALTKPVTYHHEGHPPSVLPCLLDQLENAVYSSTSGKAGGGSKLRSPLDSDALYQAGIIRVAIQAWCRSVGIMRPPARLADALDAWAANRPELANPAWAIRELDRWRQQITHKLNPMRPFQYAVPCPACESKTWVDADGSTRRWPLLATYDPEDMIGTATVECRSCLLTWEGEGIGELIKEVEEKLLQDVEQA